MSEQVLQQEGDQGVVGRKAGTFKPGKSGNPKGRTPGSVESQYRSMCYVRDNKAERDRTERHRKLRRWFEANPDRFMSTLARLEDREYKKGRVERPTGGAEALVQPKVDGGSDKLDELTERWLEVGDVGTD
jgi:hypothetical protein